MNPDEMELADAIRELDDAVHELIGARTLRDDQGTFTAPGLFTQLCEQLHQRPRRPGGKTLFESQPALWLDALSVKDEVERSVREWASPEVGDTQSLLDRLTRVKWSPHEVVWVRGLAARIRGWALLIAAMLADRATELNLCDPCPAVDERGVPCGETVFYRQVDREAVRTTALVVSLDAEMRPTGARCRVCEAFWDGEHILRFAAALAWQRDQSESAA